MPTAVFHRADAARLPLSDKSVDLTIGSPPYCDARTYGIDAQRDCDEWIDFMLSVTREATRVTRGLVLWVCAGVTRDHCYWPACEGLLYRWWALGGHCWRPAYWHRVGIPGSGGKQWLRADVEYVLAFKGIHGPIPVGRQHRGGQAAQVRTRRREMSHRLTNGGRRKHNPGRRPGGANGFKQEDGKTEDQFYIPPKLANPGNLIHTIVGGGHIGDRRSPHGTERSSLPRESWSSFSSAHSARPWGACSIHSAAAERPCAKRCGWAGMASAPICATAKSCSGASASRAGARRAGREIRRNQQANHGRAVAPALSRPVRFRAHWLPRHRRAAGRRMAGGTLRSQWLLSPRATSAGGWFCSMTTRCAGRRSTATAFPKCQRPSTSAAGFGALRRPRRGA